MTGEAARLLELGCGQLGIELTPHLRHGCAVYIAELGKWGRKINLTAIRDEKEVVIKHLLDSLTLCKVIGIAHSLLDVGSGAGLPAIPVKLARPHLQVTTVDAVEKKIIFQKHVARMIGLQGFTPLHARGEELAGRYAGQFDLVVSRAFSDLPTFVRIALPLVKTGGRLTAMKGRGGREEAGAVTSTLADMGVRVAEVVEFSLPVTGDGRSIIVMEPSQD